MSARRLYPALLMLSLLALLTACPSSGVDKDALGDTDMTDIQADLPDVILEQPPCLGDTDCPEGQLCDYKHNACVDCLSSADCRPDQLCLDGECVVMPGCEADGYCEEGICDIETGACVECLADSHCPGGHVCVDRVCVLVDLPCSTDDDCPAGLSCDPQSGLCVGCQDATDCPPEAFCDEGTCAPDFCEAGIRVCLQEKVMICAADGGGWTVEEVCVGGVCLDGACVDECIPKCDGKQCGPNGCGGVCGDCSSDDLLVCTDDFQCLGDFLYPCSQDGQCASDYCVPAQMGSACTKFCDGPCGAPNWVCKEYEEALPDSVFLCLYDPGCAPLCAGKECGPDLCGGLCGTCAEGQACIDGLCDGGPGGSCEEAMKCVLECGGAQGPESCFDGCGQDLDDPEAAAAFEDVIDCVRDFCGTSTAPWQDCMAKALETECAYPFKACLDTCQPSCEGKQCGPDGCGGQCGVCPPGLGCDAAGQCVPGGGDLNCQEGFDCLLMCSFDMPLWECREQCTGQVLPTEQQDFDELTMCLDEVCGWMDGENAFECMLSAVEWDCSWAWQSCIDCEPSCWDKECGSDGCGGQCGWCDDDHYCTDEGYCKPYGGGGDCLSGVDCVLECIYDYEMPGGVDACFEMCWVEVKPEEQHTFEALMGCAYEFCWSINMPMEQCLEMAFFEACPWEYEACAGGCQPDCWNKQCGDDGCGGSCGWCWEGTQCMQGQCVPYGGLTCEQGLSCIDDCLYWEDPETCIMNCWEQVDGAHQMEFEQILTCAFEACSSSGMSWPDCYYMGLYEWCLPEYEACVGGCQPSCWGKECGSDGCGGSCGGCPWGESCSAQGQCVPQGGLSCGQGTDCLLSCEPGIPLELCVDQCWNQVSESELPVFEEVLSCGFQVCSFTPDTWEWTFCFQQALYGECAPQYQVCLGGCEPSCWGKQCGDDGCGGSCGGCPGDMMCENYQCVGGCGGLTYEGCCEGQVVKWCENGEIMEVDCLSAGGLGPQCGWAFDMNYYWCGTSGQPDPTGQFPMACTDDPCNCAPYEVCLPDGSCCAPGCEGKQCGPDGCGGSCGGCPPQSTCTANGACVPICVPDCAGRECGPNGCGGLCGLCPAGSDCVNGSCETICVPQCFTDDGMIKQCGSDGCGGSCGVCPPTATCMEGQCEAVCVPSCGDAECGPNGCGGSCGACPADAVCVDGVCEDICVPQCQGKDCGPNGCGGSCGACPAGLACTEAGHCEEVCLPDCTNQQCGDNGCGGSCGACPANWYCDEGQCLQPASCSEYYDCILDCAFGSSAGDPFACLGICNVDFDTQAGQDLMNLFNCVIADCGFNYNFECIQQSMLGTCQDDYYQCIDCQPGCTGEDGQTFACGPDGCGGVCGWCAAGTQCADHSCEVVCQPQCVASDGQALECGSDGCGGVCGICAPNTECAQGRCLAVCQPQCVDATGVLRECGSDGCGGVCGTCAADEACAAGQCIPICTPQCANAQCGSDGCGGVCGLCAPDEECLGGACVGVCQPQCVSPDGLPRECGPDGCGGSCGVCPAGAFCDDMGLCEPLCAPQCNGRECGPDGCGGLCGLCETEEICLNGACVDSCIPQCVGKQCGSNGCGGSCGVCPAGTFCNAQWDCEPLCEPHCQGRECGADGCGGACGACGPEEFCQYGQCRAFVSCAELIDCFYGCGEWDDACFGECWDAASPAAQQQFNEYQLCLMEVCGPDGTDECYNDAFFGECKDPYYACLDCTPNCQGKECGPDGCGGQCGECPGGAQCDPYGFCPCQPYCAGRECGPDSCGGSCGDCPNDLACNSQGHCVCLPDCDGQECGPNGCGGSCGICAPGDVCSPAGECIHTCAPQCFNDDGTIRTCGPDGCGGQCGFCPDNAFCDDLGQCVQECTPQCQGKQCGDNGCGGSCGTCWWGTVCEDGSCIEPCQPQCWDKQCGSDGCGASCGTCPAGTYCSGQGQCVDLCSPKCNFKECGPDGCGGACGYCGYDENCINGACATFVSCNDILNCSWSCTDGDEACNNACFAAGSPAAKQQWFDLWSCVQAQCGPGSPENCPAQALMGACSAQYSACMGCTPNCQGKQCGDNGCGGSCGSCPPGVDCDPTWGICECQPKCNGKECGPDGCGDSCGTCSGEEQCNYQGVCVCMPACQDKQCGDNGCGGSCGTCPSGWDCSGGWCEPPCYPECDGKQCGEDGCGGSCGQCPEGTICTMWGECVSDEPNGCQQHDWPGCGGCDCEPCVCAQDPYCCDSMWDDICVNECKECGGCGGMCEPTCDQLECGTDCMGEWCGGCPWGMECMGGFCKETCEPNCWGKQCGGDGCGGSCGYCPPGTNCNSQGQCQQQGGKPCMDIAMCALEQCLMGGMPDVNCFSSCTEGASQEEQQEFYSVLQCVLPICMMSSDPGCYWQALEGQCAEQWMNCQAP